MNNIYIKRKGSLIKNNEQSHPQYLVNNFSESGRLADWTFGGNPILSNGIVTLTGTKPNILSKVFYVQPDDIICFEFTVSLPISSTNTGSGGLCLGTTYNQSVYVHSFDPISLSWLKSTNLTSNPYFLVLYNRTDILTQKHYILGSNVDLDTVPFGETNINTFIPHAIQLQSNQSTIRIRSGYNANSQMKINFSNPKIYKINKDGYFEDNNINRIKFGKKWMNVFEFYEI